MDLQSIFFSVSASEISFIISFAELKLLVSDFNIEFAEEYT